MRSPLLWIESLNQGVAPWRVTAQSVQELNQQRIDGAHRLERLLWGLLKHEHGPEIGTTSPIARAKIMAKQSTIIEMKLGRRYGTTYMLRYERHGEWETLKIYKDGLEMFPLGIDIAHLNLRNQRNIRQLLGL